MQKFRLRNLQLLVATDVAARGLDVDDLTHIIHFGLPDEVESYTHRSGRTGRAGKTGISMSICHVKEKGKIREIGKRINKVFEYRELPSGKSICEKQLFNLVDQLEKVKVNENEISSLMPSVFRRLEWLEKEDIIKRFISLEFNRMLDYYRDAPEIISVEEVSRGREPKEKGGRRERVVESGYKRLFINFGKIDDLSPPKLIELINRCVSGKVLVGKIDIRENCSFFEVEERDYQRVISQMSSYEIDGREIVVESAQEKSIGKSKFASSSVKKSGSSRVKSRVSGRSSSPFERYDHKKRR
jgi:ATP-dependent RNA helicase DeaD